MLALHCGLQQANDVATLVGGRGEVTIVQPDRRAAEAMAESTLPQIRVLAHALQGDEHFGTFDAMLVVPPTGPLLPTGAYADLARSNLRPGGRFVIDVPGLVMQPDLAIAWSSLGWPEDRLQPLRGLADDNLAEVMRGAGLRRVEAVLGSHLLHVSTPADLVDTFAEAVDLSNDERIELTHAIVRRRGGAGPLDALVHRTRLQALR
ncbi:MAG: hypothetical protein ABIP94_24415 [Planctomycetota bacterium]